jgi:hypothetical protein
MSHTTIDINQTDISILIDTTLVSNGTMSVIFADKITIELRVRAIWLMSLYWRILLKYGIAITSKHVVDVSSVNGAVLRTLGDMVVVEVCELHKGVRDNLSVDILAVINYLNNHTIDNCQSYHRSLSALDFAKFANIPEVKDITDDKVTSLDNISLEDAKKKIDNNYDKLFELVSKPHPDNAFLPFSNLKYINKTQLAHTFYQIGFRTDISDNIIRYPISNNYINGISDHNAYALESLSAKKSVFYNLASIPKAEYFGRRQHILMLSLPNLYDGDCGSTVLNDILIDDSNKYSVLYKYIVEDGKLVNLTTSNIDSYVGTTIKARTPMTCRHADGACEICAGTLLSSIPRTMHLGIFSALQMTELITQVILSAKHYQNTNIVNYTVTQELSEYFIKRKGGLSVKAKLHDKFKKLSIGIPLDDASQLLNVPNLDLTNINVISETTFGTIGSFVLIRDDGELATDVISTEYKGQRPLYSKDFIKYINSHSDKITINGDMVEVSLSDYDFKHSMFKIISINRSMTKFVERVRKFLESDISKETSATAALNTFSTMLYAQDVRPNLAYLELVIRAIMVRSQHDLRIPIVDDLDDVIFSTNDRINKYRSIGSLLAYQGCPGVFNDPAFYLSPKVVTEYDNFLNLKPSI